MSRHRSYSQSRPQRGARQGPNHRQLRVGEMLRHALSEILLKSEIRDKDLEGVPVTVTEVCSSPDMRHATVFVEPLGGGNADAVVAALNRHRGFLRGEMGHRITLKFTPELHFIEDTSFAEGARIDRVLRSERVARDLEPRQGAGKEDDKDGPQT